MQRFDFDLADGGRLAFLVRPPVGEARYRVYFIPGSGCRGLAPIASAYFRGLHSAEVVVLHKRHVDPSDWPGPAECSDDFVHQDSLTDWSADARAFLAWHLQAHSLEPGQSAVLVGSSEGAELIPSLASLLPPTSLLVLIGSTGLDPLDALRWQAERQGAPDFVGQMLRAVDDPRLPGSVLLAGRSLAYWRSLSTWRLAEPLLQLPNPVWMGFGAADAQVPLPALASLVERAQARRRSLCVAVFEGADHGLQRAAHDDLQVFWGWVEAAVLAPVATPLRPCGDLSPNDLLPRELP